MTKRTFSTTLALIFATRLVVAQPSTESLPSVIQEYADKHSFHGTVLVQRGGQQLYAKSFGIADRNSDVPNSNSTKYWIASITKAFTAVLVLQLHEEGRIDLTKSIKQYLPDYRGEGADRVTIHHLLNHTSGIQNIDTIKSYDEAVRNGMPVYQMPHTSDDLLTQFCSGKLVNEPGKAFDYNNADYIILGKIIEKVSGKSYETLLAEKILTPLGMKDSGMLHQPTVLKNMSRTYLRLGDNQSLLNIPPVYGENWYAAGGMYSTASDVLKFADALYHFKLLKSETVKTMLTPGLDRYGYGLWVFDLEANGKRKVAQRPGSIMGANCVLLRFVDDDLTIIILGNTNTTDIDAFSFLIGRAVFAKP